MKKEYFFSNKQRLFIGLTGFLLVAHIIASNFYWQTSIDNFYRPYSIVLFLFLIIVSLAFLQKENWKNKLRAIILLATISFILFNTFLQLGHLFTGQRAEFFTHYRLGKIFLLDISAIFTFVATNYTLNKIKD